MLTGKGCRGEPWSQTRYVPLSPQRRIVRQKGRGAAVAEKCDARRWGEVDCFACNGYQAVKRFAV